MYVHICIYTHIYQSTTKSRGWWFHPSTTNSCIYSTYTYIYTHINAHIYIYVCIHTYIYTYIHTCTYTHMYIYTYISIYNSESLVMISSEYNTPVYICYVHIYIHTHKCAYIFMHAYVYTYIYTYMYIHTCLHTHIHQSTTKSREWWLLPNTTSPCSSQGNCIRYTYVCYYHNILVSFVQ